MVCKLLIEIAYICDESDECSVPRRTFAPGKPETTPNWCIFIIFLFLLMPFPLHSNPCNTLSRGVWSIWQIQRDSVCTTHSLCHSNILSICSPHNDIVYEMPVFRSGMHPGCLVSVWWFKDRVGDQQIMFSTFP